MLVVGQQFAVFVNYQAGGLIPAGDDSSHTTAIRKRSKDC